MLFFFVITVNDNCINLIKSFEGLSLKPYHGAADREDVFTIGYGTIKYSPDYLNGKKVELTDPVITQPEAESLLRYEVTRKSQDIDLLLRDDLTPNQFASLISFAYNLGEGALRQSTLRLKVNKNPSDTSIKDEFLKWDRGFNNRVIPGLLRRRHAEADLYFTN